MAKPTGDHPRWVIANPLFGCWRERRGFLMKRTIVLKAAGLLAALPLAMLPMQANAYDHCPPANANGHGHHGGRQALVWPGDARRGGYHVGHVRYVAQPVVVVRTVRVAHPVVYRSHVGYSHHGSYAVSHGRRHHD